MNTVTNKHLLISILILGIITVGLLLAQYPSSTARGYSYQQSYGTNVNGASLGATAYNADYSGAPNGSFLSFGSKQPYQAVINKSYSSGYYPVSGTTTYTQPASTNTYYYYYSTPGTTYSDGYYYGNNPGYVPVGCEGGNIYNINTGALCI